MINNFLHIIATPRGDESRTLKVSNEFLNAFKARFPKCRVETLNVCTEKLPSLTVQRVDGKYALLGGKELSGDIKDSWNDIMKYIDQFRSAGAYLVSSPMWNFSIPYPLKHYIDVIIQPKYLFRYTEKGVEGLIKNKKMIIITSRGGDYGPESPSHAYDNQEPYLRAIFGLVGITDITFINAQPMDALGPEVQKERIEEASSIARNAAEKISF